METLIKKRLLILDDDPLSGQTIENIATMSGFEVALTSSPDEFFEKIKLWEPHLIALDLVMPEMDGVEVMAQLAKNDCQSSIIITSGVGSRILDAAKRSALEHGLQIAGVLSKPFSPGMLRKLLGSPTESIEDNLTTEEFLAKKAAKSNFYIPELHELESAIANNEFVVYYQPKIVCQTGVLAGFEALVRWEHPTRGLIPPDLFIEMAEQNNLIDELTFIVIKQSLEWFSSLISSKSHVKPDSLHDQELSSLMLAINLSVLSLDNITIFDHVNELCQDLGVQPHRIIFELTETSAMQNTASSLNLLTRLRMKGFQLSIDDFGTGFSSMLQLVRLPFSEMKVDKSFVLTAKNSEESRTVIKSIIDLGHSMGLKVTAEGIENEEALTYLRNINCDQAQGYFIARPMPGSRVLSWIEQRKPDHELRRLESLYALNLAGKDEDKRFNYITNLAHRLFGFPIVSINLVDKNKLWIKSRIGISLTQIPRSNSFCTYTISESTGSLVIPDTSLDNRFSRNEFILNTPNLRFYAGSSIRSPDGNRIGTLTLLDTKPREFSLLELSALKDLAGLAEKELLEDDQNVGGDNTYILPQHVFERRAEAILALTKKLGVQSSLLLIELENIDEETDVESIKKNRYKLDEFSEILKSIFRNSDITGHYGNYQLVSLLLIGLQFDDIQKILTRLEQKVKKYNEDTFQDLILNYSVGKYQFDPNGNDTLQTLLAKAEKEIVKV